MRLSRVSEVSASLNAPDVLRPTPRTSYIAGPILDRTDNVEVTEAQLDRLTKVVDHCLLEAVTAVKLQAEEQY
ncbi:hypothetical protein CIB48_g10337 [Xylaria polymorpha]|nr:hypothetical protein CIB48_g10337 [Xylaria polymorpha]